MTPRCDAHCGVEFFELCDRISWQNRNRIRKYVSLFSVYQGPRWVQIMKKLEVENLVTKRNSASRARNVNIHQAMLKTCWWIFFGALFIVNRKLPTDLRKYLNRIRKQIWNKRASGIRIWKKNKWDPNLVDPPLCWSCLFWFPVFGQFYNKQKTR